MHLVGRDTEATTVLGLRSGTLVVSGEPGAGKTALLELAKQAHDGRVLRMDGSERETNLPFSGLHQLLRPVLDATSALPERQRTALLGAVGLGETDSPDRLQVGLALLTLLSELAKTSPVLLLADDTQWIDAGSVDALTFAARRIDDEPLAVLATTRQPTLHSDLPSLVLEPLDARSAGTLLDEQPNAPLGRERMRVLQQAAGNPLALIELARTDLADATPLPLTDKLEQVFAADRTALPDATRHALLLAATDDRVTFDHVPELAPAEAAGLVRITGERARFRHPLVRSAIYHAEPMAARRAAHRELAERFSHEPDRRAWHLAAATDQPDERIAAALADSADRARQRGGHAAAATALERAAELSTCGHDRALRLLAAAAAAVYTGQPHWVRQVAEKAQAATDEPALVARASLHLGQVLTLTAEHDTALSTLMRAARQPNLERKAIAAAAVAAYYSGDEEQRLTVRARAHDDPWTLTVTDPIEGRAELAARLPELIDQAGNEPGALTSLGAMAWMLDETAIAVRVFDDALHRWRMRGGIPTGLGCSAGWAYLDNGHWAQARLTVSDTTRAALGLPHLEAAARSLEAAIDALTGDTARARSLAETALSLVDPRLSRAVAARARWALGMAAVAEGDHAGAYEQFRLLFTDTGELSHYASSYLGVAELAAAASRTGHESAAAEMVQRAAKHLGRTPSARMRALVHRAHALLGISDAESHFRAALADPAAQQWPFERAQILLDYAQWLRRRRRISEARPKLRDALERFRRLGAQPWLERTEEELRAAGIDTAAAAPDAIATLSPQQQHIVRLAAQGLSNRAIGERLFLSPRTVGSHLYRSFPKLGVTSRAQLRDLEGVHEAAEDDRYVARAE